MFLRVESLYPGKYDVMVRSEYGATGKNHFCEHVSAEPWKLNRLLKHLRYAMRYLKGNERRKFVAATFASFREWAKDAKPFVK